MQLLFDKQLFDLLSCPRRLRKKLKADLMLGSCWKQRIGKKLAKVAKLPASSTSNSTMRCKVNPCNGLLCCMLGLNWANHAAKILVIRADHK